MNSVIGPSVPSAKATSRTTLLEVSLFRLYTLRAAYFVMAAGLGVTIWPAVIHHTNQFAATHRGPVRLACRPRRDCRIGASIPSANVAGIAVRADLEGDISRRLCVAAMVRPRDQCRDSRRYQSGPDGGYFYPPYPMALCVRALRPEAWGPVEISRGDKRGPLLARQA